MHELAAPGGGGRLPPQRPRVVQGDEMHRREEAQCLQALIAQRVPRPRRRVGCRGVEHEESNDPGRMARARGGDGGLVTRDAGDQGGALYAAGIQFLDPAIRERFRCARIVPLKFAVQIVQADLKVRLPRQRAEKGG